jgi:hypothetical protein
VFNQQTLGHHLGPEGEKRVVSLMAARVFTDTCELFSFFFSFLSFSCSFLGLGSSLAPLHSLLKPAVYSKHGKDKKQEKAMS